MHERCLTLKTQFVPSSGIPHIQAHKRLTLKIHVPLLRNLRVAAIAIAHAIAAFLGCKPRMPALAAERFAAAAFTALAGLYDAPLQALRALRAADLAMIGHSTPLHSQHGLRVMRPS